MHELYPYFAHAFIDILGTLATLYAQRFCSHRWHQVLVWFILLIVVTVASVQLIG